MVNIVFRSGDDLYFEQAYKLPHQTYRMTDITLMFIRFTLLLWIRLDSQSHDEATGIS